MFCVVFGILQADSNTVLMTVLLAAGLPFLIWFFLYTPRSRAAGKDPLLPTRLFKNRTSNLGLITQNIQWLLLGGLVHRRRLPADRPRIQRHRDRRHLHRERSASWSSLAAEHSPSAARRRP